MPGDSDRIDVPIGFDVPAGWRAVDPGGSGAAFVVVKDGDWAGFTPNVTVGVTRRTDDADIGTAAADSVRGLTAAHLEVSVVDRQEIGDDDAPGITQVLRLRTEDGPLLQTQVHLTIPLGDTAHDRLLVELALTCRPDQAASVVGEFRQLVASFHLRQGEQR
jgi:hypothetical protein